MTLHYNTVRDSYGANCSAFLIPGARLGRDMSTRVDTFGLFLYGLEQVQSSNLFHPKSDLYFRHQGMAATGDSLVLLPGMAVFLYRPVPPVLEIARTVEEVLLAVAYGRSCVYRSPAQKILDKLREHIAIHEQVRADHRAFYGYEMDATPFGSALT